MLAHFTHHLLTALLIPLLPMIRSDLSLDYTQAGLVISAFSLSYGIGHLPAGWLGGLIGCRLLVTIGICGVAFAGFLVGISRTYITMIVFLVLMGMLGSAYHPSAAAVISSSIEPRNQGLALGLHTIGGSASHCLAPLIGVALASVWGWRGSFITLAVPTIVFGIIFYALLGQRAHMEKKHRIADSHGETPATQGRLSHLVVFVILSTFNFSVIFSIISFIPLFLVDQFGVGEKTAAAFLAMIYSAGLWASPLGGHLSDRLGRVPLILALSFIAGPIIYLLNLLPYGLGIGALVFALGIIIYVRSPVSEAYIVSQTSDCNRSTILGIYYFSAMEGSGVLSPLIGYLIDRGSGFHFWHRRPVAGLG